MNRKFLLNMLLGVTVMWGATSCSEMNEEIADIRGEISELWEKVEVPEAVMTQFASLYPDVKNSDWEEEPEGFEVEFDLGGRERKVLFSATGELLKVEEEINTTALPQEVMKYVQEHFADFTIDEASLVKTGETLKYEVELESRKGEVELLFDQSGKLLAQQGAPVASAGPEFLQASVVGALLPAAENANAFANPVSSWELPAELREVSSIALLADGRMACVQDEKGSIFVFNLKTNKLEEEHPFGEPGDYEGLAIDGNKAYVLRSDGTVFEVSDFKSKKPQVKTHKSVLSASQDTEGLALDKANNRLLIACKGHDKALGENKGIYELNLSTGKMNPEPVIRIALDQEVLKQPVPGKKKVKDGYDVLQPSSLEIHPQTGEYYLLDAVNNRIMVLEKDGRINKSANLDKEQLRQAEGLAFGNNGEVYISSEGSKTGKGVILKYEASL
ncbi:PepSY-like domain-containing protein [Pontibacter chinhatensis]|uniref:Uncharacterized protein YjiK n=1 Tax=Pontibacter chinhatensis TaxID=1436961 RepID=A0A1I2MPP0_9BACT|nr:PepSY-like domain-containing protein [Pontibacter chinhatensis]SFF91081.1 Uncharacterized protein YjiK [Pontibacter chinhatensis]